MATLAVLDRIARRLTWRGECLEYDGSRSGGYGMARYGGQPTQVHRIVWVEHHGPLPPETPHLRHRCDNRACCRLDHLLPGTQLDNVRDMIERGRAYHQRLTSCRYGHPLDHRDSRGARTCRICHARQSREYRARVRAACG